MENITINHLIKATTMQPYLVWNSIEKEFDEDENSFSFEIPNFVNPSKVENYTSVQRKAFSIIENKLDNWIIRNENKGVTISTSNLEDMASETQKCLKNEEINIIINPVFLYQYNGNNVYGFAKCYNKKTKELCFSKLSSSTKRKDILPMHFTYQIAKRYVKIEDVSMFIFATKIYQKNEIDFLKTNYINTTKTTRSSKNKNLDSISFSERQKAKIGRAINAKGIPYEVKTIYDILVSEFINLEVSLPQLDTTIDKVILAYKIKHLEKISKTDLNNYTDNKILKFIIEKTDFDHAGWNGKVLPVKNIMSNTIDDLSTYNYLKKQKEKMIIEDEDAEIWKPFIDGFNNEKIIWYDFEAFSLPIAPLDLFLPFQQVVSQVSIIKTNASKETSKNNLVFDPNTINEKDFKTIINSIYDSNAKYYVVYNQGYENTRLKEIVIYLQTIGDSDAEQISKKVEHIIDNTIDLEIPFKCSKNKLPKVKIPFLKGRSSIKVVEKFINSFYPEIANKAKVRSYSGLDIHNGLMAMEKANERALGIIGDKEWEKIMTKLKTYCENDVRSMIMVYYLLEKLIDKK